MAACFGDAHTAEPRDGQTRITDVWLSDTLIIRQVGDEVEVTLDWGTDEHSVRIDRAGAEKLRAALFQIERFQQAEDRDIEKDQIRAARAAEVAP